MKLSSVQGMQKSTVEFIMRFCRQIKITFFPGIRMCLLTMPLNKKID
jgi:hypothetical protein